MFRFEVQPSIAVPVSEATIFEIFGVDAIGKMVVIENLDPSNTLTYKWQVWNGSSWTDVAAFATVAPSASAAFLLAQQDTRMRLRGYGNLTIAVALLRSTAFSTAFSHPVV